jgi:hypothetical protein
VLEIENFFYAINHTSIFLKVSASWWQFIKTFFILQIIFSFKIFYGDISSEEPSLLFASSLLASFFFFIYSFTHTLTYMTLGHFFPLPFAPLPPQQVVLMAFTEKSFLLMLFTTFII